MTQPVAFITGASVRIGRGIATRLHAEGYRLILHYRSSASAAQELAEQLNEIRPDSVFLIQGHLDNIHDIETMLTQITNQDGLFSGQVDVLINNASAFYPTPVTRATTAQWDELINTNLRAPFLLAQGLAETLTRHHGCIINLTDIHGVKPLHEHAIYSASKAGLISLTQSLAKELAPDVRTNAISPGAILWPERDASNLVFQESIIQQIPLGRLGAVDNITDTVMYLIQNDYINGQIIAIDGGKSIH